MASIARRGDGQWRARYRDASGKEHSRHFSRKVDAQAWLDEVTTSVRTGTYADPRRGRLTIGEWGPMWLDGQAHLKPSTRERYAGILREHVLPSWATVPLADVTHAEVQAWVTRLAQRRSPATVHKVHRVLSLLLRTAVKDGRLGRNPADGINLPRVQTVERRYLTHDQVRSLADECGVHRLVVLLLAYTGLRFGEMAALRVGRLDLMRRRAVVAESVTLVRGVQTWGTPKGHERREVPVPRFLIDDLARHVAGKEPGGLLFTGEKGGALRAQVFQRSVFAAAAERLDLQGLHPHELRHTAASLAIASGATIKVVQQMLGHKSATMTLDLYGHLYGDQLDELGDRLHDAATAAWERSRGLPADFSRTEPISILNTRPS
jgi:integrase